MEKWKSESVSSEFIWRKSIGLQTEQHFTLSFFEISRKPDIYRKDVKFDKFRVTHDKRPRLFCTHFQGQTSREDKFSFYLFII